MKKGGWPARLVVGHGQRKAFCSDSRTLRWPRACGRPWPAVFTQQRKNEDAPAERPGHVERRSDGLPSIYWQFGSSRRPSRTLRLGW